MRRYLFIAAIVIVVLGLGVAAYFYLFPGTAGVTTAPGTPATLPTAGQAGVPGTTGAAGQTSGAGGTSSTPGVPTPVSSRLTKISPGPVVPGEAVTDQKAANATSTAGVTVTYIERESGNVFAYSASTRTLTRTSNRTLPGIQSALWLPDASFALVRYLSGIDSSTINTYALPAGGTGGFFLPQNLADLSVSSTNILSLASGVNGSTASLSRTDGTRSTTIFSSPLSALRISFAGKQYLATTKPAATLPGYAFLVDSAGHFSRVAGPLNGLVALASPSGKWLLASYMLGTSMQLELVNIATGEATPIPVATIADKCVWAADDSAAYCGIPMDPPTGFTYPDDWYQGAVQFSDRIWKIQVSGRYAQLVIDFSKDTKDLFDVESPAVDPSNSTLVFVNKNDGSLWSYSL